MTCNILLCTLGESWALIPEVYGFLAPERLPLYRHHPEKLRLDALHHEFALGVPDEIWVCTTEGERTRVSLEHLRAWQDLLPDTPRMRIWQAADTNDLASQEECEHMRELILRAALLAHEHAQGGQVVFSLAGGRKTMSADLQWAGSVIGCQALIHVIAGSLPECLFKPQADMLIQALPRTARETDTKTGRTLEKPCAEAITPVIVGRGQRSELLDIDPDGQGAVTVARFPLPLGAPGEIFRWPKPETSLAEELQRREREGGRLLGNYLHALSQHEHHENWRSLYRLPPRSIEQLRETKLTARHRDWLCTLPKADLHRHLGGSLTLEAQRQIGRSIWEAMTSAERNAANDAIATWLRQGWPADWPQRLKQGEIPRAHRAAALLVEETPERLEYYLYRSSEPRVALKSRHADGFAAYERAGELSGSALLTHPAAIEPYAEALVRQAVDERLAYLELRGSPQKYARDALGFLKDFHTALIRALQEQPKNLQPLFRFNLIADRRQRGTVGDVVRLAVDAKKELPDFIAGLDLAGDEGTQKPEELAPCFLSAFAECLPITIHAGEGEPAESIWQAAYHLHADRIGHGLSLNEHPKLATRFRDRGICLELCPTSNREVVGYFDPEAPASVDCPRYPLDRLWQAGLPLTLCTDNPGISRTSLCDEYLAAARMVEHGITCWDVLAMLKQSFVHVFLDSEAKENLIKRVDARIYSAVLGNGVNTTMSY